MIDPFNPKPRSDKLQVHYLKRKGKQFSQPKSLKQHMLATMSKRRSKRPITLAKV